MDNIEDTVPCRVCSKPTRMTGTKLCDGCWEQQRFESNSIDSARAALNKGQPASGPVPMALFQTMDSLESVVDLGLSQLPINTPNALVSILMTYHNTLIAQLRGPAEK